jgi:hypothetical protein
MKILDWFTLMALLAATPLSAQQTPVFVPQTRTKTVSPEAILATSSECKVQPSLFTVEKTLSQGNVLHTSSSLSDKDKVCIKNVLSRQKIVVKD